MAADGEGGDEPSSTFRCIDAARYALASVVTILMVVVVIKANMILRPKSLYLSVPGGSLFVSRSSSELQGGPPLLVLDFTIRAQNPSGHALLYFLDINGYIFDRSTSESSRRPAQDSIVYFRLDNMILQQRAEQFNSYTVKLQRGTVEPSYFDVLYVGEGRNIISDVTLRLDGTLIAEPTSYLNTTSRPISFYCRPLLIGGNHDVGAYINKQEAFCASSG